MIPNEKYLKLFKIMKDGGPGSGRRPEGKTRLPSGNDIASRMSGNGYPRPRLRPDSEPSKRTLPFEIGNNKITYPDGSYTPLSKKSLSPEKRQKLAEKLLSEYGEKAKIYTDLLSNGNEALFDGLFGDVSFIPKLPGSSGKYFPNK